MSPLGFWTTMALTGLGYQIVKVLLGFNFDRHALFGCFVWNFFAMLAVANGWVQP